jgi:hypothetical protein
MTITMIFGSMVAGATSEGGGAVAFPVMTLVLKIQPTIARDFSLMTQSCGNCMDKKILIKDTYACVVVNVGCVSSCRKKSWQLKQTQLFTLA